MQIRTVQSGAMPKAVQILSDKVLVNTEVKVISIPNIGGNGEETEMYEYTQAEYTKNEYIALLNEQVTDTELALTELYEGLIL